MWTVAAHDPEPQTHPLPGPHTAPNRTTTLPAHAFRPLCSMSPRTPQDSQQAPNGGPLQIDPGTRVARGKSGPTHSEGRFFYTPPQRRERPGVNLNPRRRNSAMKITGLCVNVKTKTTKISLTPKPVDPYPPPNSSPPAKLRPVGGLKGGLFWIGRPSLTHTRETIDSAWDAPNISLPRPRFCGRGIV